MNMTFPFSVANHNNIYDVSNPSLEKAGHTDIWLQDFLLRVLSKPYTSSYLPYQDLRLLNRDLIDGKVVKPSVQTQVFKTLNACPLVHSEAQRAARVYPIVFSLDDVPIPIAMFSFQSSVNPFSLGGGLQSLSYTPAAIRQYPFVAMSLSCDEDLILGIDASTLSEAPTGTCLAQRFFDTNGKPLSGFDQVAEFCVAFQNEVASTLQMVNRLNDLNVFRIKRIAVRSSNGRWRDYGHYKVIDTKLWGKVNKGTRLALADDGVLDLVLAHAKSLRCIAMLGGELKDV